MEIVSRTFWNTARAELLVAEKAHTQAAAALAQARRDLPAVALEKNYTFDSPDGAVTLADLFGESSQLIVYHLMFGPEWERPCIGCTRWANAFNGTLQELRAADAQLVAVSRAPVAQLQAIAPKYGWHFTWVSAYDSDFNYDFYASTHDLGENASATTGTGETVWFDRGENHGVSVFSKDAQDDRRIYHHYSAHNRGIEFLNGAVGYSDLLPKGRVF